MSTKRDTREWLAACYQGLDPGKGHRARDPWCLALAAWATAPGSSEEGWRRQKAASTEARRRLAETRGHPFGAEGGLTAAERREVERMASGAGPPEGSPEATLRQAAQARRTPPAPTPRREPDEQAEQRARIARASEYALQHGRK